MEKRYKIFGKIYQINTTDSYEGHILHEELNVYPKADTDDTTDIIINYLDKLDNKTPVLQNPSIHLYFSQSFKLELNNASIEFHFEKNKLKSIDFCIKQGSVLRATANKWLSYQFSNRKESIGFIFHELVLIPSAFFFPDLTVVHASAIDDNGVILFGGTGGVGKTSLELELCYKQGKSFFADDIVIINNKGVAFPNLAFPKIYAYNLVNNEQVKKRMFANAGILDKIHWYSRKMINPAIVRRRVNPVKLYDHVAHHPKKIKTFYILVKDGTVKTVTMDKISTGEAARLNKLVLETEYNIIYKHLLWDEFNSIVNKKDARMSYPDLIHKIETNFLQALTNIETFIIKIPLNIGHQDYLKQVSEILNK